LEWLSYSSLNGVTVRVYGIPDPPAGCQGPSARGTQQWERTRLGGEQVSPRQSAIRVTMPILQRPIACSAGGTGVMLNVDAVAALVHSELGLRDVAVRGIADSGWFLDREPYDHDTRATASPRVHAADGVRVGLRVWRGRVPPACAFTERRRPWMCYFGFKLYPTIRGELSAWSLRILDRYLIVLSKQLPSRVRKILLDQTLWRNFSVK